MNFFPFHIGDYATATTHLEPCEDLFYRRLLDLYYSDEQPPPADIAITCRLVRAQKRREKQAVQNVLEEFFTLTEAGWMQRRCEKEITHFLAKSKRGRNGARVRWGGKAVQDIAPPAEPQEEYGDTHTANDAMPGHAASNAWTMPEHAASNACTPPEHPPGNAEMRAGHAASNATNTSTNPDTSTNPNPNPNPSPDTRPNPIHRAEGNPGAPALPVNPPGVNIPDPPASIDDWAEFFCREGFDADVVMRNRGLRGDMGNWVAQRIGQGLMRNVMRIALQRLGERPASPRYYAGLIDELRRSRESFGNPPPAAPPKPRPPVEKI